MKITPWKHFGDLEEFFTHDTWFSPDIFRESRLQPAIDIYETDDAVIAEASVPDFTPEQIEVEVEGGYLTLQGTRDEKKEEEDKKKGYWRREIRKGSFTRSVQLPKNIDENSATATYEKGVLKVILKKNGETKTKKIKVAIK